MITVCQFAAMMLGVAEKDLPVDLLSRLSIVSSYCQKTGGELESRQVVASIVMQWELDNPLKWDARGEEASNMDEW